MSTRAKIDLKPAELGKMLGGSLQILSQVSGDEHVDLKVMKLQPLLLQMAAQSSRISSTLVQQAFELTTLILETWSHLNKKKKHMRSGSGLNKAESEIIGEWLKLKPASVHLSYHPQFAHPNMFCKWMSSHCLQKDCQIGKVCDTGLGW